MSDEAPLTWQQATDIVANGVLQLPSNTTNGVRIRQAIQAAGDEFVRKVRPIRNTTTVTTTFEDPSVEVIEANFMPRRLLMSILTDTEGNRHVLEQVDVRTVIRRLPEGQVDVPKMIGFENATDALVWPIPSDEFDISLTWTEPFFNFVEGVDDPDEALVNIPPDLVRGVLWYGAPAYYNRGTERTDIAAIARREFDRFIAESRGTINDNAERGRIEVNPDAY